VKLLALGGDHRRTPTPVREALAFEGARRDEGLDALATAFPGGEFVVLSTCNRVEVYAAGSPSSIPTTAALIDFLAHFHARASETFAAHLVDHQDGEAVSHLFKVAASLESLVLGEGQILGQVRDAYKAADARKTVGPILHAVFPHALRVGKLVREQTGMDKGKLSIASVAVDVAKDVFDKFSDKTVLVIGAGKMGDLTLQHLSTLRPGSILVTNRNPERAEAAARRWGGKAISFEQLDRALIEADLVVSTTSRSWISPHTRRSRRPVSTAWP
jgi:glutamyl-tRNA reductase